MSIQRPWKRAPLSYHSWLMICQYSWPRGLEKSGKCTGPGHTCSQAVDQHRDQA